MSEIKFSGAEDELLIHLVENNPPLFDPEIESYKDPIVRENIWKDIADKMERKESECKKRWKYIRDSYNRFKRKRKMQTGSAAPSKHSKWEFFERLQFLERISLDRVSIPNTSLDSIVPTPTANGELNPQPEDAERSSNVAVEPMKTSSGQPPTKKHRKVQDGFLDYLKKRDENRQMLFEELSAVKVTEIDDDINSFGNHVKSVLRKLNPRCQLQAKAEIFSVLTKYEMIQVDMECGVQIAAGISSESAYVTSVVSPDPSTSASNITNQTQGSENDESC